MVINFASYVDCASFFGDVNTRQETYRRDLEKNFIIIEEYSVNIDAMDSRFDNFNVTFGFLYEGIMEDIANDVYDGSDWVKILNVK